MTGEGGACANRFQAFAAGARTGIFSEVLSFRTVEQIQGAGLSPI